MSYNLFLDDFRMPEDVPFHYDPAEHPGIYTLQIWDIVRSYRAFVDHILHYGVPQMVSFDHDLAAEHYANEMFLDPVKYKSLYNSFKEKTGLHCAKWLKNHCTENRLDLPAVILCHSRNPVGRANILEVFGVSGG